jgi:hypothetical protein
MKWLAARRRHHHLDISHGWWRRQPCSTGERAGPGPAPLLRRAPPPRRDAERSPPRAASAVGRCRLSLIEEMVGGGGRRMGIGLSWDSHVVGPQGLIGPNFGYSSIIFSWLMNLVFFVYFSA